MGEQAGLLDQHPRESKLSPGMRVTRLKTGATECSLEPDAYRELGTMRVQTENWSSGAQANHTETGSLGAHAGTGVAGSVRSTKDRAMPALEVRAGRAAVGHTTQDTEGFLAAPTETELKRTVELSGEQTAISLI